MPERLQRYTHDIHPPDEEPAYPCCRAKKVVFAQDVTEELEIVPAQFYVNRYVRDK